MSKPTLTLGKLRALHRCSTSENVFTILALDHRDSLRRMMRPEAPESLSDLDIVGFKLDVVTALRQDISGVLLDPYYGAAQAIQSGAIDHMGLLVELEQADDASPHSTVDIEIHPDWSPDKIKRMGGDGVKLFFQYDPTDETSAWAHDRKIRGIADECSALDIPLFAKPVMRQPHTAPMRDMVIAAAQRIGALGVDVLKLEFPAEPDTQPDESAWVAACRDLTESLDIPWVLLSAGVPFETFQEQARIACQNGAAGFIAGRAIWGDATQIKDRNQRREWLWDEGRRRIQVIAETAHQFATPWTEHFKAKLVSTTWFKTY